MKELEGKKENIVSRREALKKIASLTGVVTLSHLPMQWGTPKLSSTLLPPHAQTSSPPTAIIPPLPTQNPYPYPHPTPKPTNDPYP